MPAVVHIVTRKPLVHNSRILRQARTLRQAGYEVLLLGVRRGPLPASELHDGLPIVRVAHDPLPERASHWLRGGGLSPSTARAAAPPKGLAGRARHALLRIAGSAGTLPWLVQSLAFDVRAYRTLRAHGRADVVHASDVRTLPVAALLSLRTGARVVYDAPELFTGLHVLPRAYRALLGAQERVLIRFAARFLVVNPMIGDVLAERLRRRPDAVVLNCPPYVPPDRLGGPGLREALGVGPGVPLLVYAGGLLPLRGIEETVLALHGLPGAILAILGEGDLRSDLEALAAREGLAGRVRFHPYVPADEVAAFASSADVGVVAYQDVGPNHRLCSPTKLFEYLMAGLPVACSDLPYLRAVVQGEGVGEVFDPADPAAIAAAVARILAGRERYREPVAAARHRYAWERQGERLLEAYASLIPPSGGTAPAAPPASARPRWRPRSASGAAPTDAPGTPRT